MREPVWIDRRGLLFLHEASLAAHGGTTGVRDEGVVDVALSRARDWWLNEPEADLASLAASYGFGLAKNRAFVEGNKRTAFQAIGLFLSLNGFQLEAEPLDAIGVILNVASSELCELDLATWIRKHSVKMVRVA
jgi:death-on-curing protein